MNTSSTCRRLTLSLLVTALFAYPAVAQQSFGIDAGDDAYRLNEYADLSTIIAEVREVEHLPLIPPTLTVVEWSEYGDRLETALSSGHRGLKYAALRLIIAYGEHFDLSEDAVFDVMRIYRDGDADRVRRMAVVALARMDSDWAMKFLERSVRFEKSDQVKHTIRSILHERNHRLTSL